MKKFKYLKISNAKKLRYLKNKFKNEPYIIFLHGFMSDIEGEKPSALIKFANKKKIGFLAIEYSGHGKSSGEFTKGNISSWSNDIKISLKRLINKKSFILVGSSMGAWISLIIFKYFKDQIKGFVGIGSAPEFTEKIMWKNFSKKTKKEILKKGISYVKSGEYVYPITRQFIKDGKANKVLSKKIHSKIKVTMLHGKKDDVVPVIFSKKVLSIFPNAKKNLRIIKDGDHSLSKKRSLIAIVKELNKIILDII